MICPTKRNKFLYLASEFNIRKVVFEVHDVNPEKNQIF
jgi:hypothetical protein